MVVFCVSVPRKINFKIKKIGIEIRLPLLPNKIAKLIKLLKSLLNYYLNMGKYQRFCLVINFYVP